jgi:hypothetical protein
LIGVRVGGLSPAVSAQLVHQPDIDRASASLFD